MSKAIAWQDGWQGGPKAELEIGRTYYAQDLRNLGLGYIKSLQLPDECKAICDRWGDMKWTNPWDRVVLFPNPHGYYEDLGYWLQDGVRAIRLEYAKGIKASSAVTVYQDGAWHRQRGGYGPYWCLPIGTSKAADRHFLFDVITDVDIPEGVSAEFIDWHKGKTARTLYPGTHSLADYGLNDRVDDVVVTGDSYEYVRTDWEPVGEPQRGKLLIMLKQNIDNRKGTQPLSGDLEFAKDVGASVSRKWESSSGLSVTLEVGTGEGSPVQAKVGVTASQSWTVGKDTSQSETVHVAQNGHGTAGPGEVTHYGMAVYEQTLSARFTAVFRNKRDSTDELHRSGVETVKGAQAGTITAL